MELASRSARGRKHRQAYTRIATETYTAYPHQGIIFPDSCQGLRGHMTSYCSDDTPSSSASSLLHPRRSPGRERTTPRYPHKNARLILALNILIASSPHLQSSHCHCPEPLVINTIMSGVRVAWIGLGNIGRVRDPNQQPPRPPHSPQTQY